MPVLGQGGVVIKFVNTSCKPVSKKSSFEIEKGKHGVYSIMRGYKFVFVIKYDYGDK
jgi:hypothetical protein